MEANHHTKQAYTSPSITRKQRKSCKPHICERASARAVPPNVVNKRTNKPRPVHYRSSANVEISCPKVPPPLLQVERWLQRSPKRSKAASRRGSRRLLCTVLSLETTYYSRERRARARGHLPHVERTRSCRFADSAGAWHGAQQLERCTTVRSLQEDMPGFQ